MSTHPYAYRDKDIAFIIAKRYKYFFTSYRLDAVALASCLLPLASYLLPAPCSLLPAPCSLLPAPCSLKPKT
ncbi:hypothetical protein [Moorena sp. SIO4G3]|uniref:hypothetical protein n=1 Tax=Moorena sp. SIO4G3 TaxID=2607821 RepID=UPI0025EF1215|nr:hypothetical protein [Moorena sp. SIO4G3]